MKRIFSILTFLFPVFFAHGQTLTYHDYMRAVLNENLEYLAEKFNIDIADANLQAAKVFNDPELSVVYGNNQDWDIMMGQVVEAGLSFNPDLAGVRRARINCAADEKAITEASVAAFLENLKFEAAAAWAEAWRLREGCKMFEASVAAMMQIARSDSLRFASGEISMVDANQSHLEATTMNGNLMESKAEYANALMNLSRLSGGMEVRDIEDKMLPADAIAFSEEELVGMAEENRADLKSAELSKSLSANNLKLIKASRAFEMDLNLDYSYHTRSRNEIAPAPIFNAISVGVTIPLKFSSINKGEVRAAQNAIKESEKYYEAALLQVQTETCQAYNAFHAADEILRRYDSGVLRDAAMVVESRRTGYKKGESSLIELLSAQQTYRNIMQGYIEACAGRFVRYAEVERAVGQDLRAR